MSTLKEEREAIVDMIDDIMAKYHMGEHMYSPEREEIVATILSYEEKVMERVRNGVEGMKVWFMEEDYHNTFPLISKEDLLDNLK